MAVSKAAQRATAKYKKVNYDAVNLLLPKGTKERIRKSGKTINGFICEAVEKELKEQGF